jgi:phenylacetate-CoA ligase
MAFIPLRKIPGQSWPELPPAIVSPLWAMYLELERTQWLAPAEILEGQLAPVRALLAHCSQHVPYYQDILTKAGIRPAEIKTLADFRRIPPLQRRDYQDHFPRLQACTLPAGTFKTNQGSTSRTRGIPIEVWQTNLVNLWWLACYLRDLTWSGVDPRGSLASIRNFSMSGNRHEAAQHGITQPCWSPLLDPRMQTGPAHAMDIQQNPRRQLKWLIEVQPNYFLSTPSNVILLANLLEERGERIPSLRAIQVIAETLTEPAQQHIESVFGVPVKNLYSCMEAGYVASPCPDGHGLHIHAENVLVEVLNERDQPCRPGETGRVIMTALCNFLTPFIRYEILDLATVGPERCPCGRGLPLLTRIEGKMRPMLRLPDGRYKASHALVHHLFHLHVYHQHQIVQRSADHLIVRLIPNRQWTAASRAQVVQCVQEYFEAPIRVEIDVLDRLPLTAAGKLRDVVIEGA